MRIAKKLQAGLVAVTMLAAPGLAAAHDDVYFGFGYRNGNPAQRYHPPRRSYYYYAPPVVVAPPGHYYYSPAPVYFHDERCPPRRYQSLNQFRFRDHRDPRRGYHYRRYAEPGWYR